MKHGVVDALESALALGDTASALDLLAFIDGLSPGIRPPFFEAQAHRFRARMAADAEGLVTARLGLPQVAVDAKSNEITAIPRLIELLDLKDCVVTIDAAGCQKEIAAQIVAKEADYVLALKGNQPTLYEQVSDYFLEQLEKEGPDRKLRHQREVEEGHGRSETRETFVAPATKAMVASGAWLGLATVVLVIRRCVEHATGKAAGFIPRAGRQKASPSRSSARRRWLTVV